MVGDNNQTLKFFDYNLKFIKSEPFQIFYKDFEIFDNGRIAINASKMINYKENNTFSKTTFNNECYSLWLYNNGEFSKYLPFDIKTFPNGSTYNELKRNFYRYKADLYYNQPLNDTIFKITNKDIYPTYKIDFGAFASKEDLMYKPGDWVLEYFKKDHDAAYMPQNIIETDKFLKFDFIYGNRFFTGLYTKNNKECRNGELQNDLFGLKIVLNENIGNDIISYVSPVELLKLMNDPKSINEPWFNNLKAICANLNENDNYLLLRFQLK